MKKTLLLSACALALSTVQLQAQMPRTLGHQWTKAFPAVSDVQTEQVASEITSDGRLVSVINFRRDIDADPNPAVTVSVTTPGNVLQWNGLVTISDQNENYQTHVKFSCSSETKIVAVATDNNHGIYILGYNNATLTVSDANVISTIEVNATGSGSYFLAKINTNGFPQWAYSFNKSSDNTYFNTIAVKEVSGVNRIYVGGGSTTNLNLDIKNGTSQIFNPGNTSTYPIVISYDTNCNYVTYNYMIATSGTGHIKSMVVKNNNLYMTGVFAGNLRIPPISVDIASKGGRDIFAAKYTDALQPTWAVRFGSDLNDIAKAIAVDDSENVYVGGEFVGNGFNFDPAGSFTINGSEENIFLTKLNVSGGFEWGRRFYGGTNTQQILNSIAVTPGGDVFMTGQARLRINVTTHDGSYVTTFNPGALNNNNALDIFLYRLDTNGNIEMNTHIGSIHPAQGTGSSFTSQNYERGTHLIIRNGNLYLSANTTIMLLAETIDFNPAPFTFSGLTDYLSATNQYSTATLTKYYVCTDNSSAGFPSSLVGSCPNQYLQYVPNPNSSDYSYYWNCAALGISSDSVILNIANPSSAYDGKIMNLQITDTSNGCYKHLYAPIDGSTLSTASTSITADPQYCNGGTYTLTATGSDVKWYANFTDTIPVASGNTYTYTPNVQQTTAMAIYAGTTNTVTGCENPRAFAGHTVNFVPQPVLVYEDQGATLTGPMTGCADGQARYVYFGTDGSVTGNVYADSASTTNLNGNTNPLGWWNLADDYNMNTPDTITVWVARTGWFGSSPSISCESIRYPVNFVLNDCTVGIDEYLLQNEIRIYPNPASSSVTLENIPAESTITVFDMTGKTVYSTATVNSVLNIKTDVFENGIYHVQIENNGLTANKKLVINR